MKVVLFCGGYGLRLRDHEPRIPKPVVPLGSEPLVVHVMRYYAHFGHCEFILCLGYKGEVVKELVEECVASIRRSRASGSSSDPQDMRNWDIQYVDTGLESNIATRLTMVRPLLGGASTFLANYSDSLCDANLPDLLMEHGNSRSVASFMCVRPHLSLHHVEVDESSHKVRAIKGIREAIRINGGFFTLNTTIFDYIRPGEELVEEPFARLIAEGALNGYVYDGFWSTVDTYKDHLRLDTLLKSGMAPWQIWKSDVRLDSTGD